MIDSTVYSRSRQTNLAGLPLMSQTSTGSDRTPLTHAPCVPVLRSRARSQSPEAAGPLTNSAGYLGRSRELLAPSATQGKTGSCA